MNNKEFKEKWSNEIGNNIYHSDYVKDFINDLDNLDNWISVEDELPKESGWYLVIRIGYIPYTAHFHLQKQDWVNDGHEVFPTHWQLLPQNPKEKK